jgi:uncharacterized DUF497 family protein
MPWFIWDAKNTAHIDKHGVTREEAEYIVENGVRIYQGEGKWRAVGQTSDGYYLQVVFMLESDVVDIDYAEIDLLQLEASADSLYVIHARPLTPAEKSKFNRQRKRKGQ